MELKKLNYDSLFGSEFTDVNKSVSTKESSYSVDENLYQPKLEDAKKGVYTALIRFIPNPTDYSKSIINKTQYFFKDVDGENGVRVDSPESVGQRCPIGQLRAKLWKTGIASNIEIAKKNASKENKYWSLIYIYKDPQHPELEGQVKVFRFGKKLYEKYLLASSPNELEGEEGIAANHLLFGKNLRLVVKKKEDYVNYDDSEFSAKKPLEIDGVAIDNSERGRKLLAKMYAEAPDLSEYEFQPWDETQTDKVLTNIKTYDRLLPNSEASRIASKSVNTLKNNGGSDGRIDERTIDSTDFSDEVRGNETTADNTDSGKKSDEDLLDEIGDELDL